LIQSDPFSSIQLGDELSRNRFGLAPLNTGFVDSSGHPSRGFEIFHELYASAGLGVVFIGGVAVSAHGAASTRSFVLDTLEKASALSKTVSLIREHNAVPVLQLMHAGRQADLADSGKTIFGPSPIPCPVVGILPKELSVREIDEIVEEFVKAAEYALSAGIRLIELHAAHGYLIAEFLSPYTNKRSDYYGGSFSCRFRFLSELISAVRSIKGIAVGVRISGDEFVEGGINEKDLQPLVKGIEDLGAAYVSVSAGVYDVNDRIMPDRRAGEAVYGHLGRAAKKAGKIPVLLSGNIGSVHTARFLLERDCADIVLMGRALLSDPWLIRKSQEGNDKGVQACTMCRMCKYHSRGLPHISCPHNEILWGLLRATVRETGVKPKRIPVVGSREGLY
jgi:2,4-dienoyl-CoA reductase-like NADH-dependent reductase (Old Yellow Enzyme family)